MAAATETAALLEGQQHTTVEKSPAAGKDPVEERVCYVGRDKQQYLDKCAAAQQKPHQFCDNEVTTSKYTIIPFKPNFIIWLNLYEQFQRAANVYFLCIAILQIVPGISPTGRFTTIMPLSLVMFLSMLKDAYEDFRRHRQDAELNRSPADAWRDGKWTTIPWRDVSVGDILQVKKSCTFPADMIILWSSEAEGLCYIETASLDGETNLKIRKSCGQTWEAFEKANVKETQNPGFFSCTVNYEMPNNRLYNFDGAITMDGSLYPLNADNIFLRGAMLRNTERAYGMVIFTGKETKLMKNSSEKRHKMSNIDVVTNRQIGYIFLLQVALCLICAVGLGVFTNKVDQHWYLADRNPNPAETAAIGFLTFLILYNNLIPISLYVSMEVVKLVQARLIDSDVDIYHEETDTAAYARTSALNEELGQVSYVLSDKTGTLTCNMMDFTKFSCLTADGTEVIAYGKGTTEIARAAAARAGKVLVDERPASFVPRDGFCLWDEKINDGTWRSQPNAERIKEFIVHLAVCHTVVAEYPDTDPDMKGPAVYQAASPDEGCLVKAARELGVTFVHRTESAVTISDNGKLETWELLAIVEFDSTRKRMSTIVRSPQGKLLLYCKGADSVIYERLKRGGPQEQALGTNLELLTKFAEDGLRTLVIAKAELDEKEYAAWAARYKEANCAITNRSEKVAAVGGELEKDLVLVGATAIEDKLQKGVPQTIELLMAAGVKVWVLTGDKQETAINIGYACALLNNDMTVWTFDDETGDTIKPKLDEFLAKAKELANTPKPSDMALVIQGGLLEHVLETKRTSLVFLELATMCKAVICCRVSPLQKALVTSLVRENIRGSITLAIGDGANDVSMITAASVGVGISGLEGLQAARASDYSIAQFRFLQRLLLVHGRWNYRRIARLIQYSFYKNISLYATQFWFCLFNGFSGQTLYDQWALAVFNVIFTSFPVMVLAVIDRDVEPERVLAMDQFPDLYQDGLRNRLFNTKNFWIYVFNALYHSALAFFIPMLAYRNHENTPDGLDTGIASLGVLCYTVVVVVVTIKVGLEMLTWTWLNWFFVIASIASWFVFVFVYGAFYAFIPAPDFAVWYDVGVQIVPTATFWLILLITPIVVSMRDYVYKAYRRNVSPELSHVIQVLENSGQRFCRADVQATHEHLLGKLETMEARKGAYLANAPQMSMKTGYAFSQQEGQSEVAAIFGRAFRKKHPKKDR